MVLETVERNGRDSKKKLKADRIPAPIMCWAVMEEEELPRLGVGGGPSVDPLLESLPRLSPLATMLKWRALCSGQAVGRGLDTCLELANQIL